MTLEDGEEEDLTEEEKNIWEKFLKLEDKNQVLDDVKKNILKLIFRLFCTLSSFLTQYEICTEVEFSYTDVGYILS